MKNKHTATLDYLARNKNQAMRAVINMINEEIEDNFVPGETIEVVVPINKDYNLSIVIAIYENLNWKVDTEIAVYNDNGNAQSMTLYLY